MNNNTGSVSVSFALWEVLQIVFITLKLCKVIAWPWYLVLLPIEIEFSLILVALIIFAIIFVIRRHR